MYSKWTRLHRQSIAANSIAEKYCLRRRMPSPQQEACCRCNAAAPLFMYDLHTQAVLSAESRANPAVNMWLEQLFLRRSALPGFRPAEPSGAAHSPSAARAQAEHCSVHLTRRGPTRGVGLPSHPVSPQSDREGMAFSSAFCRSSLRSSGACFGGGGRRSRAGEGALSPSLPEERDGLWAPWLPLRRSCLASFFSRFFSFFSACATIRATW